MLGLIACPYFDGSLLALGLALFSLGATLYAWSTPVRYLLRHLHTRAA